MVVLSQPALEHFSVIETYQPSTCLRSGVIPVIDVRYPEAKSHIVEACEKYGFFKLINHGVPLDFMADLEAEAVNFFNLPQSEKDKAGPPDPYGYGSKRIGPNGDVGWIEYLLLNSNPQITSQKSLAVFKDSPHDFRSAVENYITEMKKLAYEILELMADGLRIEPRNTLSNLIRDEKSDSCFRLNHYPACPEHQNLKKGSNLIGFGEHTDPQILSVLRSNNTSGLEICLRDGTWVSVPADQSSFFISVGDALQVMTNGRFQSVKHRVLADTKKSRISMIYFGGPPLNEKIAPLPCLVSREEDCLYKEFTWFEYKYSAYKSKLADHRLGQFEK